MRQQLCAETNSIEEAVARAKTEGGWVVETIDRTKPWWFSKVYHPEEIQKSFSYPVECKRAKEYQL